MGHCTWNTNSDCNVIAFYDDNSNGSFECIIIVILWIYDLQVILHNIYRATFYGHATLYIHNVHWCGCSCICVYSDFNVYVTVTYIWGALACFTNSFMVTVSSVIDIVTCMVCTCLIVAACIATSSIIYIISMLAGVTIIWISVMKKSSLIWTLPCTI